MEAKGIAVWQPGVPVICGRPGKEAALPRQGTANARGDEQESSQAGLVGRVCNTRQSPLSILSQIRILGAHVQKDACSPRESCHDVRNRTDQTVRGGDHVAEVSRGHSSRWKTSRASRKLEKYTRRSHPDEGPNGARPNGSGK